MESMRDRRGTPIAVTSRRRRSSIVPADIERPLPHNLDAERSVLGAILLDNHALNAAAEKLRADDFFLDQHRRVFQQMIVLGEAQKAIDLVTLTEELDRRGELEAAGGAAYLAQLVDGVPRVSNVDHYARIVKEKAVLRNLIHTTYAIQQQALEAEEDADAILDRAESAIGSMRSASAKPGVRIYTAAEMGALVNEAVEYLCYPFAVQGMVALLDGAAKAAGKTTLLLAGVGASLRGEIFLNRATKRARVLLVTEENAGTLRLALQRGGLSAETDLHVVPFASLASMRWPQLMHQIERACSDLRTGWLIVDTFFAVAGLGGEQENQAGAVDEAIAPLRALAGRLDIAVSLARHTRKAGGSIGESGRGSTALTGACDIVCELKRLSSNHPASVRQLEVTGRVEQARLLIELRDGHYISHGQHADMRVSTAEKADVLAEAIAADPKVSSRELARRLGIGRNRVRSFASKRGWFCDKSGCWKREAQP